MSKLQVLGPGCFECQRLFNLVEQAAQEIGFEGKVEKVKEVDRILSFGVLRTPALAVNGRVVIVGRVPPVEELKEILTERGLSAGRRKTA